MATPTPMKHAASQQGRTPSQLAAATPPVSTPFSNPAHAAFSPRGPRSSPQQVKKSPATSSLMANQPSMGGLNFDSPSTAAAMGALGMGGGFDIGLDGVGVGVGGLDSLGVAFASEDDKLKRLDSILQLLNVGTVPFKQSKRPRLTNSSKRRDSSAKLDWSDWLSASASSCCPKSTQDPMGVKREHWPSPAPLSPWTLRWTTTLSRAQH